MHMRAYGTSFTRSERPRRLPDHTLVMRVHGARSPLVYPRARGLDFGETPIARHREPPVCFLYVCHSNLPRPRSEIVEDQRRLDLTGQSEQNAGAPSRYVECDRCSCRCSRGGARPRATFAFEAVQIRNLRQSSWLMIGILGPPLSEVNLPTLTLSIDRPNDCSNSSVTRCLDCRFDFYA